MPTQRKIDKIYDLLTTQGQSGNWDYDPYMCGLYNGLELARCILEDNEPNYRSKPPTGWLRDQTNEGFGGVDTPSPVLAEAQEAM